MGASEPTDDLLERPRPHGGSPPRVGAVEDPVRRIALLLAGFTLVGSGVAAMITAELGVAPYDVVVTGLVEVTGWPIGVVAMILPIVFTGVGFLLGGRVGPATLLAVL